MKSLTLLAVAFVATCLAGCGGGPMLAEPTVSAAHVQVARSALATHRLEPSRNLSAGEMQPAVDRVWRSLNTPMLGVCQPAAERRHGSDRSSPPRRCPDASEAWRRLGQLPRYPPGRRLPPRCHTRNHHRHQASRNRTPLAAGEYLPLGTDSRQANCGDEFRRRWPNCDAYRGRSDGLGALWQCHDAPPGNPATPSGRQHWSKD